MQLGLVSRTPKYIGPEESLDVSIQITLGKNETAINGDVRLDLFLIDNYNSATGTISGGFRVATASGINIKPGSSATLRFVGNMPTGEMIMFDAPDGGASRRYIYGLEVTADRAGGTMNAHMLNVGYLFSERKPPEITEFSVVDTTGALNHFGQLAQYQSLLTIQAAYMVDPLVPGLKGSAAFEAVLISGETGAATAIVQAVDTGTGFTVADIPEPGTLVLRYTATDAYGISTTEERSFAVFPYSTPVISELFLERYKEFTLDDGSIEYRAAPDGTHVWLTMVADACPVLGKNAWSVTAEFAGKQIVIASGDDGSPVSFIQNRAVIPDEIPVDSRVEFVFTIRDFFVAYSQVFVVEKSGADVHITPNGTAIGQRSTGQRLAKRFEVARDFESFFYGGISGVTNYYTEERPTGGRYIDGKPVYRKTFAVNATSTTALWQSEAIEDFDRMVNIYGAYTRTATGTQFPIFFWAAADNYHYTNVSGTDGRVNIRTTAALTGYVTIEYTKTTDF